MEEQQQTQSQPELEIQPEPQAELELQPEPQAELESETEPQPQPELESETEPQPQPELQAEPQAELESETEPQPQPELQAEPQAELESEAEPQPQPGQATINQIIIVLNEQVQYAQNQIRQIVQTQGEEFALTLLEETLVIESQGGLMIKNGTRRRTPGGVFLRLARQRVPPEILPIIWPPKDWKKIKAAYKKKKPQSQGAAAQPASSPFDWNERKDLIHMEIANHRGPATTAKIVMVGRPGRVIEKPSFIITSMKNMKQPPLPKGIPIPPQQPTSYTVYIAKKQWNKVQEAIKNVEDQLVLEGIALYDPELEGVAIYSTSVTTKHLQSAKRQGGSPPPQDA